MSQNDSLYRILSDGLPHRADNLVVSVYGFCDGVRLARLSARVYDVKMKHSVEINSWPDKGNKKLWWYQLVKIEVPTIKISQDSSGQLMFA